MKPDEFIFSGAEHKELDNPEIGVIKSGSGMQSGPSNRGQECIIAKGATKCNYAFLTLFRLVSGATHPYGFGWALGEVRGHRIIEHGGAWQGFKSFIARYVGDRLTVVVLMNLINANPDKIAHSVAGLYIPELMPPDPKPVEAKKPGTTALLPR